MLTIVAVFVFVSLAKYSTSTGADFETLYTHTHEFITTCNGEHVRCATDMCEYVSYFLGSDTCWRELCLHFCAVYGIVQLMCNRFVLSEVK